jgi:hypothetical protein
MDMKNHKGGRALTVVALVDALYRFRWVSHGYHGTFLRDPLSHLESRLVMIGPGISFQELLTIRVSCLSPACGTKSLQTYGRQLAFPSK